MEIHPSSQMFDGSEMTGMLLGATPLLEQSWEMCLRADRSGIPEVDHCREVVFLAFPRGGEVDPGGEVMVKLQDEEREGQGPFSPLTCHVEVDQDNESRVIMVRREFLRLFRNQYNLPEFKEKVLALAKEGKSIVITGHSTGATTASLTTLWLLCQSIASPLQVLCITFGSPLLGNGSLSLAILQESWGGNFCHVISKHDIIPSLYLFAPLSSVGSPEQLLVRDRQPDLEELFKTILSHTEGAITTEGHDNRKFWPFGSALFCSKAGAICMDNAASVIKMMHLMLQDSSPRDGIEHHLGYGDITSMLRTQSTRMRNSNEDRVSESSYESSIHFALQSIGISSQGMNAAPARACLQMARRMGLIPVSKAAELAVKLGRIHPYMAQLEWYKKRCEEDYRTGYYDAFKGRPAMKRENKVNMNLLQLGAFWDEVIATVERNEVPQDFTRSLKWKYAPHTYMLLAEPLEIARYYRQRNRQSKGHYIESGREKRFRVFDKWWQRNTAGEERGQRNHLAGLTQDPLFWARVEEARERIDDARQEKDPGRLRELLEGLRWFEEHAAGMIERKEVSPDVLFPKSSYTQWAADWEELKSHFIQSPGMTR